METVDIIISMIVPSHLRGSTKNSFWPLYFLNEKIPWTDKAAKNTTSLETVTKIDVFSHSHSHSHSVCRLTHKCSEICIRDSSTTLHELINQISKSIKTRESYCLHIQQQTNTYFELREKMSHTSSSSSSHTHETHRIYHYESHTEEYMVNHSSLTSTGRDGSSGGNILFSFVKVRLSFCLCCCNFEIFTFSFFINTLQFPQNESVLKKLKHIQSHFHFTI